MKKLIVIGIALCCAILTGCGKSNRERFEDGLRAAGAGNYQIEKFLGEFDEASSNDQLKFADMAEYMKYLHKVNPNDGFYSIKTKSYEALKDADLWERKELLKKMKKAVED